LMKNKKILRNAFNMPWEALTRWRVNTWKILSIV
jgi:hypothetical protein